MAIQGYVLLEFDDSGKSIFDTIYQETLYKFNIMVISGLISPKRSMRRTYWDWIDAEDKAYEWEQLTVDELLEMVRSGRVELGNHSLSGARLNYMYGEDGKESGTADSGSTTTTVDAERDESLTDYWKRGYICFTSGPNDGLCRKITAFDPATDTLTHDAFPNAVASGHTYDIMKWENVYREVMTANELIKLITGSDPTYAISSYLSGNTTNMLKAFFDEWFAVHVVDLGNDFSDVTAYRNAIPCPEQAKAWAINDKNITDNGWSKVDDILNDARNNHYLHILEIHDISDTNLADNSRNLSLANWATLKDKLADFHSEDRLVLASQLGTLT